MKLSDYVIDFLVKKEIVDIFMVSGGGIIHLVDSVGRNDNINYFCNHNEQATGYCAEGYARQKNAIAACLVTTGPGSTNTISGVAGAWVDSVPMIVISGQVKKELIADYTRLRQLGEQEINIIDMVKPVTKYAVTVDEPDRIRYELEKAVHSATTGRKGPVWINIPLDVQGSNIDENGLKSFAPDKQEKNDAELKVRVAQAARWLKESKRPVFILGHGIRLAQAEENLLSLCRKISVPALLSFNGMDLLPEDHPCLVGRPGIIGQRRANFAVQNADFILSIGARMNIKIVGYDYKGFAPKARKVMVDIDHEELNKSTVNCDLAIDADAKNFLSELNKQFNDKELAVSSEWLAACRQWKGKYPNITDDFYADQEYVNSYVFYDRLSDMLEADDTVVTGNGLAALNLYQAFKVKESQRAFTNNGYGAMGYGLPAAIGACIAHDKKRTICVTGDGSLQMNIQELGLIGHNKLPLKIFILNNLGYTSIRLTQDNFFKSHYVGADDGSGVSNPDFQKIAEGYGLAYARIQNNSQLDDVISKVLSENGPALIEVIVSPKQGVNPKTTSSKRDDGTFESRPLEDMYPFLSREELKENMRISEGK